MLKSRIIHLTVACLGVTLGLAACQGSRNKARTLSYEFKANGCTTGQKTFTDLATYCKGLKDDKANNNCASEKRLETFNMKCSSFAQNENTESQNANTEAPTKLEKEAAQDQSRSYDFTTDNCTTGKKTFPDLATYCNGLKDDTANNHCAAQMRIEAFKQNCVFDMKKFAETEAKADPNAPASDSAPTSATDAKKSEEGSKEEKQEPIGFDF
ncbi:MAG: hypothetical protein IPM97_13555 [Bdellovibrionaceae bacterium]|nr:hypothetical protein [Pseudobdellovibrionaceae bacterium]